MKVWMNKEFIIKLTVIIVGFLFVFFSSRILITKKLNDVVRNSLIQILMVGIMMIIWGLNKLF
jgi:cytochrome c biogenesis protein CcdA